MSTSSFKSTRSPLSDRSNNPTSSASLPTSQTWHEKQFRRKLSNRQLFPNIDSSEETPSEHSSIYDAIYWTPDEEDAASFTHNKENVPEFDTATTESAMTQASIDTLDGGARFINRPRGTPLETIIEQNSYATLRTKPSIANTKRLYTPIHLDTTSPYALQHAGQHGDLRRKISFSVNDTDMYELVDKFPEPPCTETDVRRSLSIKPPQSPPARMPTPKGLPRWPGDLPTSNPPPASSSRRSFRGLFHAFRISSAPNGESTPHALRTVDTRNASSPTRTGRSYWRPPRSGQLLHNNVDAHPFHNAPVAAVRTASTREETRQPCRPASIQSSHDGNVFDHPLPSPTSSQLRSLQSRFTFNDRPTPTIRLVTPTSPILSACDDDLPRSQVKASKDSSLLPPSIRRVSGTPPPRVEAEEQHMDQAVLLNQEGADLISSLNLQDIAVVPVMSGALQNSTRSHFSDSTTSHISKPSEVAIYDTSSSATSLRTYTTTPLPLFHTHSQHIPNPATLYPPDRPSDNNSTNTFESFRTSSLQTALSSSSTSTLSIAQNNASPHLNAAPPASLHSALFPTHLSPFLSPQPTAQNPTPLRAVSTVTATGKTNVGSLSYSSLLLQHPRPLQSRGLSVGRAEWITRSSRAEEEEEADTDTDTDAEGDEAVCGVRETNSGVDVGVPEQEHGETEVCPHRVGRSGGAATRHFRQRKNKTEKSGNGIAMARGKRETKCWRCRTGDRSREVVCWVLGYCFCQPVEGYGYSGPRGSGGRRKRERKMGIRKEKRERQEQEHGRGYGGAIVSGDSAADSAADDDRSVSVSVLEPARVLA